jgi:hypothetical protein
MHHSLTNSLTCNPPIVLQTASEGRNITDVLSVFLQENLKWGFDSINFFVTL